MIATILRWASLAATAILLLSFGLFVLDQTSNGSKQEVAALNADARGMTPSPTDATTNIDQAAPSAAVKRERSKRHSALREKLDEADDLLVKPFAEATHSKSIWVQRTVPTLIALLVFGLGLRLLSGYAITRP